MDKTGLRGCLFVLFNETLQNTGVNIRSAVQPHPHCTTLGFELRSFYIYLPVHTELVVKGGDIKGGKIIL